MKASPRILIVDDNQDIIMMLSHALSRHGFLIDAATSSEEALARVASAPYDAAIVDLVMPGQDGAALASALRQRIAVRLLARVGHVAAAARQFGLPRAEKTLCCLPLH